MKTVLLYMSVVLLSSAAMAQNNYSKNLAAYCNAYNQVHDISGSILVTKNGKPIYEQSFGKASREWNIDNTKETKFWIASVAKQFTAAAILQLEEQGRLKTSDKLNMYFPDYPKGELITLHMLLNHTSGIKECSKNLKFFNLDPELSGQALQDSLLGTFKNEPFDFEPGTFWSYSNSGYFLLGYIVEQVTGQNYGDYITKNLLEQAGMKNSGFITKDAVVSNISSRYAVEGRQWKVARNLSAILQFSAGGIYSTTTDLFLWRQALNSGKIISKASLEKMNTPNHEEKGAGYGIFIDQIYGHKVLQHQGANFGVNTYLAEFPDDAICMVILMNRDTNLDFLPKALAAILFDQKVLLPYKRGVIAISETLLPQYVGEYYNENLPFPVNLISKENKLFLQLGRDIELVPESATKFFINEPDVEIQVEFEMENNKISRIYFIESGVKTEVRKK